MFMCEISFKIINIKKFFMNYIFVVSMSSNHI